MIEFLSFILLFFIVCLFIIVVLGYTYLKKGIDTFRSILSGNNQRDTYNGNGRRHGSNGKQTVIDRRSPEEANRKIIPSNEGEYVEFEEE